MPCEAGQKSTQHAAFRIKYGVFQRRTGPCRNPGRVANNQRRTPGRKHVSLQHFNLAGHAEPRDIFIGAGDGARILVGGDHMRDTTAREHGGEHAGAGADIKGELFRILRQRRRCNQRNVLTAHRREHAVMRMNATAQRGNLHAFFPPLMRAIQAK